MKGLGIVQEDVVVLKSPCFAGDGKLAALVNIGKLVLCCNVLVVVIVAVAVLANVWFGH
jgi:hypothetical protein